jgi:methyltransferase (TIGR00027 family)
VRIAPLAFDGLARDPPRMSENPVRNVSDTARWVASYRAEESARPDAWFKDPLAERLAGERGRAIAARASIHSRWALVTRTKILDDMVMASISDGVDCVVNLAAGFDARPYRLELPKNLRWVEVDLPDLIAEKNALLEGERARCQLERIAADLSDAAAREEALAQATRGAKSALVITEGLVMYLETSVVESLARELAQPPIKFWILDFSSPAVLAMIQKGTNFENAPLKFAPEEGVQFFIKRGWKAKNVYSAFREAARLRRLPLLMRLLAWIPQPDVVNARGGRWTAFVRLEQAA